MRKSASEIVNDLETRVANLEKSAIFGLFRRDREEPMSLREKNLKRRQREQDEREELNRKELKMREKRLKAKTKDAQKRYEKFMDEFQYLLFTEVDDLDVDMRRGDISGVITMGRFEYKIMSELGEVGVDGVVNAKITIIGPGLRKPLTVQPLIYSIRSKTLGGEEVYTHDAYQYAPQILKALKKAVGIAHSDKAVSDRAEAKRMRKEKYRLANRRQASYISSLDRRLFEESREGYTSLTTKALMRLNEHDMNVDSTDESPLGARQGVIEFDEMVDLLDKRSRSRAEDKLLLDYANEVVRQFGNLGIV